MKIAVLGGGNGASAAAADLTEKGHEVRWWRRNAAALKSRLTLKDADGERAVAIQTCSDIGEAVRGAELIFMPDPAFTQEDNAARLAPHLADDQIVFLAPGTFGSYVMASKIRSPGSPASMGPRQSPSPRGRRAFPPGFSPERSQRQCSRKYGRCSQSSPWKTRSRRR